MIAYRALGFDLLVCDPNLGQHPSKIRNKVFGEIVTKYSSGVVISLAGDWVQTSLRLTSGISHRLINKWSPYGFASLLAEISATRSIANILVLGWTPTSAHCELINWGRLETLYLINGPNLSEFPYPKTLASKFRLVDRKKIGEYIISSHTNVHREPKVEILDECFAIPGKGYALIGELIRTEAGQINFRFSKIVEKGDQLWRTSSFLIEDRKELHTLLGELANSPSKWKKLEKKSKGVTGGKKPKR